MVALPATATALALGTVKITDDLSPTLARQWCRGCSAKQVATKRLRLLAQQLDVLTVPLTLATIRTRSERTQQ